ncbi:MAG: hypothetical protein J0L63_03960 [Anaerolineae bacterium]|nr:hypothetical protein [Anaerolineae bacterium]
MEWIFLIVMAVGLIYLLMMILGVAGNNPDFDVDSALKWAHVDGLFGSGGLDGEASGLGCGVIAAFLAGFGAVGLTGTAAGWNPVLLLVAAVVFGWLLGRGVTGLLKFVYAQQGTDIFDEQRLIGVEGRVTIDSPAGKMGEAMIELGEIRKYAIMEVSGMALHRGDTVEVRAVEGRVLRVKKKREGE